MKKLFQKRPRQLNGCGMRGKRRLAFSRGTIGVDDEGNVPARSVLIEDGILRGYMQDRQSAEFFGGRVNFRYYISMGALDDNLETAAALPVAGLHIDLVREVPEALKPRRIDIARTAVDGTAVEAKAVEKAAN